MTSSKIQPSSEIGTAAPSSPQTPQEQHKEQQKQQHYDPSSWSNTFEALSTSAQFSVLVVGVFFFFGIHNLLQEAIMQLQDKKHGVMLGYTEVLGVVIFSYLERTYVARERGQVAPMSYYPLLTACLLGSSALSNIALNYINFPTKVVFRSSKLIPTMLIASVMHRKVFSSVEYTCAMGICVGLILFAAADWELAPTFHPIGLILVTLSVFSDAILPNAQERLFGMGASRLEVTLFTNVFALMFYTASTLLSGDMTAAFALVCQNQTLAFYYIVYITVAYLAISVHMNVVKRFGGVAAVLVATGRKGMTLTLSFLLFPKAFSWYYPIGALLVLGGLLVASLHKMRNRGVKERPRIKVHASDIEAPAGK
eukprot:CAMPEP_0172473584 /NCGR_PEP_ID=MMETSP1065-20121228/68929_1 /TAXON_ID=265537 /ORGANISM="Amphiprora paludosa, Strain CCMP125" /LENGTH=367 /DNA_ID=CAMNT_0013231759 /DNA_START=105 /DNA_END=1208 /DNA_ORIENTATION=+